MPLDDPQKLIADCERLNDEVQTSVRALAELQMRLRDFTMKLQSAIASANPPKQ